MTNLDSIFKSSDITLPKKVRLKLSTEELMLLNCGVEKTLESPLDCKEMKPGNSKGNKS